MQAVDLTGVAQMELGLVIQTIAGWVRTNEMAQRRWWELPEGERGMVDTPAVCTEQADMLARNTSLETLKVYGDALRGTLTVLTRVQAAHSTEVTVRWSRVSVRGDSYPTDVDGDESVGDGQHQDRAVTVEQRLERVETQVTLLAGHLERLLTALSAAGGLFDRLAERSRSDRSTQLR